MLNLDLNWLKKQYLMRRHVYTGLLPWWSGVVLCALSSYCSADNMESKVEAHRLLTERFQAWEMGQDSDYLVDGYAEIVVLLTDFDSPLPKVTHQVQYREEIHRRQRILTMAMPSDSYRRVTTLSSSPRLIMYINHEGLDYLYADRRVDLWVPSKWSMPPVNWSVSHSKAATYE